MRRDLSVESGKLGLLDVFEHLLERRISLNLFHASPDSRHPSRKASVTPASALYLLCGGELFTFCSRRLLLP
eukprot:755363-Pleurochrysis_carterae.AAC.5